MNEETFRTLLVLVPALPLAAAIVTALAGARLLRQASHWPLVLALAGSLACSLLVLREVANMPQAAYEQAHTLWTWVAVEQALGEHDFVIGVTLRADPLTAIMLVMVTVVSLLVVIFASGYMHGDRGYWRFFALVGLFVFSMTMLVSVSDFLLLFVFWEAVGLCSYLLIGFWYERPQAAAAGKKAFLVNRIGDFGFALAVFLIWTTYGTLSFHDVPVGDARAAAGDARGADGADASRLVQGVLSASRMEAGAYVGGGAALAICLLLLAGACGKSAQFPLHVWLPDAMEGPTPVSALIHAATMVTAGVYMVARAMPLFAASPEALLVVSAVGGFTALLAALIALTQTDLKRILAYSTISQLGLMFLALGTGTLAGVVAAMFHLFTHAFFKALLFLGAGSVMHAMGGVIDVTRFGGLRRLMPITFWTFLAGALALAGFPLLSGFWSKDAILGAVYDAGKYGAHFTAAYTWLYVAGMVIAGLTAVYTFRAFFLTFYGRERIPPEAGHHAHESPPVMTVPLALLALAAVGIGGYFHGTGQFADLLARTPSLAAAAAEPAAAMHWNVAAASGTMAVVGVALAAFFFLGDGREAQWVARGLRPLYVLSYNKFYLDELYYALAVWPLRVAAELFYFIDRYVIDGIVDTVGQVPPLVGRAIRPLQNGLVQFYALAMAVAVVVLLAAVWWR
jgi:NADH-quinone oxidoreductase subunit L